MSPSTSAGARVCGATGLTLVPAAGQTAWRIAKAARGPLCPPRRQASGDRSGWGRFDTPGARTAYFASTPECAYAEVLAYLRRRLGDADPLAKDAATLGVSIEQFLAEVEEDWSVAGHMALGHLPRGWRSERRLYELALPDTGWWVNLATPESIAVVEAALADRLASASVAALDLGVLYGTNRAATTEIALWVNAQTLDDGSGPLGIVYDSRHATGLAWAHWLDDTPTTLITELGADTIVADDPDLLAVTGRFAITVW